MNSGQQTFIGIVLFAIGFGSTCGFVALGCWIAENYQERIRACIGLVLGMVTITLIYLSVWYLFLGIKIPKVTK